MSTKVPITVAHGDGIGPEIMNATLHILQEAGAGIDIETIEIGEKVHLVDTKHPKMDVVIVRENEDDYAIQNGRKITQDRALNVLARVNALGVGIVQTQSLRMFDGKPGFTLAQGQ